MISTSTTSIVRTDVMGLPKSWLIGTGYLALYLVLYWATYLEPLPHTSITPWNPNTGAAMALLLARGARWAPLVALGVFLSEMLIDVNPPPWWGSRE